MFSVKYLSCNNNKIYKQSSSALPHDAQTVQVSHFSQIYFVFHFYMLSHKHRNFNFSTSENDQCLHIINANRKTTVNSIPAYLIHWSTRFRLSISLKTEFDIPTVLRMSNAFRCALCTNIYVQMKMYMNNNMTGINNASLIITTVKILGN